MIWIFAIVGLLAVIAIALVIVGRETERLAARPRPAIFDVHEAVGWIAYRLPRGVQGRLSHDDVHWILLADAELLEDVSRDPTEGPYPWVRFEEEVDEDPDRWTVDEDLAIARILSAADAEGRDLADVDVAEVLVARARYLEAIGAIGRPVEGELGPGETDAP